MDHQKIIDLTQLIELVNNDRTTLQQMLHLFITQSEEKLHAAIEALNKSDFKNLKEITHDLKGSSGMIGADSLMRLFKSIEESALASDTDRCQAYLKEAATMIKQLEEEIKQFSNEA